MVKEMEGIKQSTILMGDLIEHKPMCEIFSNREDEHSKWDKEDYKSGVDSARQMPVGTIIQIKKTKYECFDKVIMPIDTCPQCKRNNTYHKKMNSTGNYVDNVYNTNQIKCKTGRAYFKFDYCFECSKEFLIEAFFYKKLKSSDKS